LPSAAMATFVENASAAASAAALMIVRCITFS
jgi:hypothetical protein